MKKISYIKMSLHFLFLYKKITILLLYNIYVDVIIIRKKEVIVLVFKTIII